MCRIFSGGSEKKQTVPYCIICPVPFEIPDIYKWKGQPEQVLFTIKMKQDADGIQNISGVHMIVLIFIKWKQSKKYWDGGALFPHAPLVGVSPQTLCFYLYSEL